MRKRTIERQKKKVEAKRNYHLMIESYTKPIEQQLDGMTASDQIQFLADVTKRLNLMAKEVRDPDLDKIIEAVRRRLARRRIAIQASLCPADPSEIRRPRTGSHSIKTSRYTSPKFVAVTYAKPVRG